MKKGFKKFFSAILAVCMLLSIQPVTVFAESPHISLNNGPVYTVEAGKENKVEMKIKNNGIGAAYSISYNVEFQNGDVPFTINFQKGSSSSLAGNNIRTMYIYVTVDASAKAGSYPVTIRCNYQDEDGNPMENSFTIYIRVKNGEGGLSYIYENLKVEGDQITPGGSAGFGGTIKNNGTGNMVNVELTLGGLTPDGISLSSGFNNIKLQDINTGESKEFHYQLVAGGDMEAGNYPIELKLTYEDEMGKAFEETESYYVNVGGVTGKKGQMEIRNLKEPGGTYGVNSNFTISFDLYNMTNVETKDIVVTAEAQDATAVVPKSASVKSVGSLKPNEHKNLSFTFAATESSKSQNYAICFTVEYTTGGSKVTTFKQYAGVNVYNPDDEDNASKPKIIVSKYTCDPIMVNAGEEFDLNLTLLNTHPTKKVENIKMFLTLAEETSSDTEKTGNIFTPVNSSNTFYFDSIGAKGEASKSLRLYVVPSAQPKTYTLTVNFEYEDSDGKEYTAQELLGINVQQKTELTMDDFELPPTIEAGMPVSVSFSYYNTGKVSLNNLMISVEGDVTCSEKNTYVGTLDSGQSDYYEVSFTPNGMGTVPVSIVLSYEDPSGETIEERRDFEITVTEPVNPDLETMEPEQPAIDMKKLVVGILLLAAMGAGLWFFIKKQKENPESVLAEDLNDDVDDDDGDEDDDDDEEGMSK